MSRLTAFITATRHSAAGRWYFGRERHEQQIIAGVGALVLISVIWVGIWKPVSDWQTLEANRQQNAQQLLDWMRANEKQALASGQNNANKGSRALIPVITKAAVAHELKLNRLQPESNGIISVILQKQSFNQIVQWVSQLDENNGVSVNRASFDSQDDPGYVNAQLRLN